MTTIGPGQLTLDDEREGLGQWIARIGTSPLTRAERERIRSLIDQRQRELLRIPTEKRRRRR